MWHFELDMGMFFAHTWYMLCSSVWGHPVASGGVLLGTTLPSAISWPYWRGSGSFMFVKQLIINNVSYNALRMWLSVECDGGGRLSSAAVLALWHMLYRRSSIDCALDPFFNTYIKYRTVFGDVRFSKSHEFLARNMLVHVYSWGTYMKLICVLRELVFAITFV